MGISSDALLVYGFDVGETPDFLAGEEEFEDFVVRKAGLSDADWETKWAAVEACPAGWEQHCCDGFVMFILAVPGTTIRASRGYPKDITPDKLVVPQEKIDAFLAWCSGAGIEVQTPQWLLTSWMG